MATGQGPGTGMMKVPTASGGLTPAQPWTGQQPWQPGGWRQATTPFGMLMPMSLPGMQQQRAQQAAPGTAPGGAPIGVMPTASAAMTPARPAAPADPLADLWASFNYGSSSV